MAAIPSASRSENILARQQQRIAPAVPPVTFSGMKVNEVQSSLLAKLHEKHRLLDQREAASPITRKALVQQSELLKKELEVLNQYDEDQELPDELRFKLELLANEIHTLKGSKSTTMPNSSNDQYKPTAATLPPPPSASVVPTKQRSKNIKGSSRNPDIAFATEIGQGLLVEIRKLQNLLQEKEDKIKQLELKQNDNEMGYDDILIQLRKKEDSEERLEEENWNLELANQELRDHLLESNQTIAKHNAEYTKLTRQLKAQTEQIEILKAQEEKSVSIIEAIKARHEQESFNLKKLIAQTQREANALKTQVEELKAELQICQSKLAIKQAAFTRATEASNVPIDTESTQEVIDENPDSVDEPLTANNSTQQARNQALETETLKQSLAHAHRIISNLRSSAHKEKIEKFELKKLLADSQEIVEQQNKQLATCHCNRFPTATVDHRKLNAGKRKPIVATKRRRPGAARRAKGLSPEDTEGEDDELVNHINERLLSDEDDESVVDDLLDPYFSNNSNEGNVFTMSNNNNNSNSLFPAFTAMKPLSSELKVDDERVNTCDIGVNTDSFTLLVQHRQEPVFNAPAVEAIINVNHVKGSTQFDSTVAQTTNGVETVHQEERHKYEKHQPIRNNNTAADSSTNEMMKKDRECEEQNDIVHEKVDQRTTASTCSQIIDHNVDSLKTTHQPMNITYMRAVFLERAKDILSPSQIEDILPIFNAEDQQPVNGQPKQLDYMKQLHEDDLKKAASTIKDVSILEEVSHVKVQHNEMSIAQTEVMKIDGSSSVNEKRENMPTGAIDATAASSSSNDKDSTLSVDSSKAEQEVNPTNSELSMALTALEMQRIEFEDVKALALSEQKEKQDAHWQQKLQQLASEKDAQCAVEVAHIKARMNLQHDEEMSKQRFKATVAMKEALEEQRGELEAAKNNAMIKLREDLEAAKQSELESLSSSIEAYKKEAKLTNQRMKELLTKESADILIKRAVEDAVSLAEKKHGEVLSTMISKEAALQMVQNEVAKALEKERNETKEKEGSRVNELQMRLDQMIPKAEAEEMTKVAVADALMKEREAMAARKSSMYSKEQVDVLIETAVREAINKERSEHALLLATERKSVRDKEQLAFGNRGVQSKFGHPATETPIPNRLPSQSLEHGPIPTIKLQRSNSTSSRLSTSSTASTKAALPPLSPSVSTPAVSLIKPRLQESSRANSFRSKLSASLSSSQQKSKRASVESTDSQSKSYGSVRILETSNYNSRPYQHLQARSCMNLRDLSRRQASSASISTISSNEDGYSVNLQGSPNLSFYGKSLTDMSIIMAVTQTVIGEEMYKHTRRYVGSGFSANNHRRYFWVHPYTNTLYWSTTRPGPEGNERKTKRIFVQSVVSIANNDSSNLSTKSLIISTPKRKLKITPLSLERHDVWFKALTYLVQRPIDMSERISEETSYNICTAATSVEYAGHKQASYDTLNDLSKNAVAVPSSGHDSSPHLYNMEDSDSADSEELIDVRQCCGGKHDLSTLSKKGHHHHS